MKKISVNQLTTMRWSFDEDVVFYRSRGIKRIGVSRDKATDFGIEKCRELLTDAGMTASSYGTLTISHGLQGPSLAEQIWQGQQQVEEAAGIGAGHLIFQTGGAGGHLRKNRFCVARKVLDKLLPVAEEYGVRLAMEPLATNEISGSLHSHSLDDCVELIDQYQTRYLGLVLDLFHVRNAFRNLQRTWVAENVCLVQMADFVQQGNRTLRAPLGTGKLDLSGFSQFIKRTGYEGVFEFELFGERFDLISYQQTISAVADNLAITPAPSAAEFASVKA